MADLEKVIKVTQSQYDILASGGSVGSYVGLSSGYIYLVEDPTQYATVGMLSAYVPYNGANRTVDLGYQALRTDRIEMYNGDDDYDFVIQPGYLFFEQNGAGAIVNFPFPSINESVAYQNWISSNFQAKGNYAPSAHASTGTTYGAGTTTNYGHVKLVSGNVSGTTYAEGIAAAASHNHNGVYLAANTNYTSKIKIGTSTTEYAPSSGIITLPAYPTIPASLPANGGNASSLGGQGAAYYASAGALVNADWNATSGLSSIKNKPTIPTNTNQTVKVGNTTFSSNAAVNFSAGARTKITAGTNEITIADDSIYTISQSDITSISGNVYTFTNTFRDIVKAMDRTIIVPKGFINDDLAFILTPALDETVTTDSGGKYNYVYMSSLLGYPWKFTFVEENGTLTLTNSQIYIGYAGVYPQYYVDSTNALIWLGDDDRGYNTEAGFHFINTHSLLVNAYIGEQQEDISKWLISRSSTLPGVDADSPDFVAVGASLYTKEYASNTYSYKKIYPLTYTDVGAASAGHAHTLSIEANTGTANVTLAFGSSYKLTAGGNNTIFKMPANPNNHYTSTFTVYGGTTSVATFNQSTNMTLSIVAGNNITVTPDATNHKITISGTGDTHYTSTWSIYAGTTLVSTFNQSANRSITFSAGSNIGLTATANSGVITISATNTTYGAQSGISLSNGNFGHANTAITAQNTQAVYPIKIDAYGHITGYGTAVTIPTVYNATLTVQKNGTNVGTFTANQSTNSTINITVPDPANYYWANVKVAAASATNTAPTFATASLTSLYFMSGTTSKAYMQYNATEECIDFIFN